MDYYTPGLTYVIPYIPTFYAQILTDYPSYLILEELAKDEKESSTYSACSLYEVRFPEQI